MASYITPYSGAGSFLPSGYMQAATAGAQSAARSIERGADALGDGLAKGIEKYKKNKADDQAVSTMLETTLPGVLENSQLEMRAGNDDEEAAGFLKQAKKFQDGDMKLSEKTSFAASLMLFQKREGEEAAENTNNQQFWYNANAMKENADRTFTAEEAARLETKKYQDYMRSRGEDADQRTVEDRERAAAALAAKEKATGVALGFGSVPTQNTSNSQVDDINPAFTEYQSKVADARSAYEAKKTVTPEVIQEFRSQPEEEVGRPSKQRRDAVMHWMDKNRDAAAQAQRDLEYKLPRNYPETGMMYNMRTNDTEKAADRAIYDNSRAVIDHQMRVPRGIADRIPGTPPSVAPDAADQDLINSARGVSNYGVNALPPVGPAFDPSSLGPVPPETIPRDVTTTTDFTPQEQLDADLAYIEREMGGQPNSAKMAALQAIRANREQQNPQFKSIPGPNGRQLHKLPTGYTALTNPVSVQDQIAINREEREQRALTVPGFTGTARTVQQATDFTKELMMVEEANQGIDSLLNMIDTGFKSLSPEMRGVASSIQSTLIGSLRLKIVGPGALSEKEVELLKNAIANPTEFFRLDKTTRASLMQLKQYLSDGTRIGAKKLGFTPDGGAGGAGGNPPGAAPDVIMDNNGNPIN